MTTVKFDKLKDKVSDFQIYLKEKKNIEGKVDGETIEFEDMKPDKVKILFKKYLHKENLKENYRIISKSGILTVVEKKYYEAES